MYGHWPACLYFGAFFSIDSGIGHRLDATAAGSIGRKDDLSIIYLVCSGGRRLNATFHPVTQVQQGLIERGEIINHLRGVIYLTVRAAVYVPKAEIVVCRISQVLLDVFAVPVTLPCKGFPVPYRAAEYHLSMNLSRGQTSGCILCKQRSKQHRALRVDWLSICIPELIPGIIIFSWQLVPVVSFYGYPVAVVNLDTVANIEF